MKKLLRTIPFSFSLLFSALQLSAQREIIIDTGTSQSIQATVTVNGLPFVFPNSEPTPEDTLIGINRLEDGTVELIISGDLVLNGDDTVRGIGDFPTVIRVGNDVIIPEGAVFDFSAVNTTPGAGGGSGQSGGTGGKGGAGGSGGRGGDRGEFGSGGLIYTPNSPVPLSITTPGIPAKSGANGEDGKTGSDGTRGNTGRNGLPGYGTSPISGGASGNRPTAYSATRDGGTLGDGGDIASYPPAIFFNSPSIRDFIYNEPEEGAFLDRYYNGDAGEDGTDGVDLDDPDLSGNPSSVGRNGFKGQHVADLWTLTGGGAGGSGSGGSGGSGGTGGGGGGGGAGGHGEWAEPIPTDSSDIFDKGAAGADEALGKLINKVVNNYLKKRGVDAVFDIFKVPTLDYGATGARGGDGGDGRDGGRGGQGGNGGSGGAGGGALMIEAQGRILFDGTASVNGGNGTGGDDGFSPLDILVNNRISGDDPGNRLPGFGMSTVLEPFSAVSDLRDDPNSGLGGEGGSGGTGGKGSKGLPGGNGAGGAGGTIVFSGSSIVTASGQGRFEVEGGYGTEMIQQGSDGRIFIGSNTLPVESDTATELLNSGFTLIGTPAVATTREGPLAENPFIAGRPATPTISELDDGAEAFGFLEATADNLLLNGFPLIDSSPMNAVLCAMRLDVGPTPLEEDYLGYDVILVFNAREDLLSEVRFGINSQAIDSNGDPIADPALAGITIELAPFYSFELTEGGYQRDPNFGGSGDLISGMMDGMTVYAFLVPEDTAEYGINFSMFCISDGSFFSIEDDLFEVDEVLCTEFDPNVPVYESVWVGPSSGGPDGDWSIATNWVALLDGVPQAAIVPDNTVNKAFNVDIDLMDVTVSQDVSVEIDTLSIGETSTLRVENDQQLIIEKFQIRTEAGVIDNSGTILVDSTGDQTTLRFSGSNLTLTGDGELTTSYDENNLIAGLRSTDSLIQETDHTIRASGNLGGNTLNLENKGEIRSHIGSEVLGWQTLTVDPVGDRNRRTPSLVNEGRLVVGGGQSELNLSDGYYENAPSGFIGFAGDDEDSEGEEQVLTLEDMRLEGSGSLIEGDVDNQVIHLTGVNQLDSVEITSWSNATIYLDETELFLNDSTIYFDKSSTFSTWTSTHLGKELTRPGVITDSDIQGGTLSYRDVTIDPRYTDLADCESPIVITNASQVNIFSVLVEGDAETNRFEDITIGGSYCYDRQAQLYWGYDFDLLNISDSEELEVPNEFLTLEMTVQAHILKGSITNNGFIRFLRTTGTTDVLVDSLVNLEGRGGWSNKFNTSYRFLGYDSDETDQLVIGSDQTLFNPTFNSSGSGTEVSLFVDNSGELYGASWEYDTLPADAPTIAINRGIIAADRTFGGGSIDNQTGSIDLGEYFPEFDNVRIFGGDVILDREIGAELLADPDLFSEDVDGIGSALKAEFDSVRFSAPAFSELPDIYYAESYRNIGAIRINDATIEGSGDNSTLLRNVELATHTRFDRVALAETLTLGKGTFTSLGKATIAENTEIVVTDELGASPYILLTEGISGTGVNALTFPSTVKVIAGGNLGGDTLTIINETDITTAFFNAVGLVGETMLPLNTFILDAPGDASAPVGFINRGRIFPIIDELGDASEAAINILPGNYDNREGSIFFANSPSGHSNNIDGALIEGGVIGSNPDFQEAAVFLENNVFLRNLRLENIQLDGGPYTLDSVSLVTDDGAPNSTSIGGDFTIQGELTYDAADGNFTLLNAPTVENPVTDRLVIGSGTTLTVAEETATQAFTSLRNAGTLTGTELVFATPLTATGEMLFLDTLVASPDAPIGTLVTLKSLELSEDVALQASGTIENSGTIYASGLLQISEAVINNQGGLLWTDSILDIADSLIQNQDGELRSLSELNLYNAIIFGGQITGSPDIQILNGGFGAESITTLSNVSFGGFSTMTINEALLFCVGEVGGAGLIIENYGEILLSGSDAILTASALNNYGSLSLNNGTVKVTNNLYNDDTNTIGGDGILEFGNLDNQGHIAPGFSAGRLEFRGPVSFSASAVLEIELAGLEPGTGHDFVLIQSAGATSLDGEIEVSIIEDFGLCYTDTFTVFTTSGFDLAGEFSNASNGDRIPVLTGGSIIVNYGHGSAYATDSVVLSAYIAPIPSGLSSPYSATISVTELTTGNAPEDIDLLLEEGASPGIVIDTASSNRADYWINFLGSTNVDDGVMLSSIAQDIDAVSTITKSGQTYVTSLHRADATVTYASSVEINTDVSVAWFDFDFWYAGHATNSSNNQEITNLNASAGITLGDQFIDQGDGVYTLDLTEFGATPDNGILLTNGGKNEANFTHSYFDLTTGVYTIELRDVGSNIDDGSSGNNGTERDPVAFAFVPFEATIDTPLIAAGRIDGNGDIDAGTGNFTIEARSNNTFRLRVSGQTPQTSTLLVSPIAFSSALDLKDNSVRFVPGLDYWDIVHFDVNGESTPNIDNYGKIFNFALFHTVAPIEVTTCLDENDTTAGDGTGISLREAVRDVIYAGTRIHFGKTLASQTAHLMLGEGEILIDDNIIFDGSTLPSGMTLSGEGLSRIFTVEPGASPRFNDLTFANGNATGDGGAILNQGELILERVTFRDNFASGNGGAIANAAGATLRIENATLTRNSAPNGDGGAIYNLGSLFGYYLTIASNDANRGGGITSLLEAQVYESILAYNTAVTDYSVYFEDIEEDNDIYNEIFDGDNLFYDDESYTTNDPLLNALGDYGGLTQTMLPMPNSFAIGEAGIFISRETDQRGFDDINLTLGAVDFRGSLDLDLLWETDADEDGFTFATEYALGGDLKKADAENPLNNAIVGRSFDGKPTVTMGLAGIDSGNLEEDIYLIRIIKRSTDLITFKEIFRHDDINGATVQSGFSVSYDGSTTPATVTVIDESDTPPPAAFYIIDIRQTEEE